VTEARLDPRVRSLLEDELEERNLDMDVAREMLETAKQLEGEALEAATRELLEED
jgi:hypothetical protein